MRLIGLLKISPLLFVLHYCTTEVTPPQSDLSAIVTAPITITRASTTETLAIELRAGKLFLNATANSQHRQFIFDTGSPTLLTREFADQLELTIVGQNTGRDANGTLVTMDLAVLATLELGELVFQNVPVLVFDPPAGTGSCLFDGGVIGSEIFPGSAWRIDLEQGQLDIESVSRTPSVDNAVVRTPLYDAGYPHAPIIDYYLADTVADKALFDTGSADSVVLFAGILQNPGAESLLTAGSLKRGFGFAGGSAGGLGQAHELVKFSLNSLHFGGQVFPALPGTTRTSPPSLLGAGLLNSYVVTLDYIQDQAVFEPRLNPVPDQVDPGYGIALVENAVEVVQLFESSAAAQAGLQFGDRILSIQGESLQVQPDTDQCSLVRWLLEEFDPAAPAAMLVERAGEQIQLQIPPPH